MKLSLAILISLMSLSSFASNLEQDLKKKTCEVQISKSISLKKNEMATEVGVISILSLFHGKKLKLSAGSSFPIVDVSDGSIAINQGTNLIFLCINDGDSCLSDLTKVLTKDISKLSNEALRINCQ